MNTALKNIPDSEGGKVAMHILPVIVIAQFCCTSLWFASNAVMDDLVTAYGLDQAALGHLTSAIQFGFIVGTMTFALLTIPDRYSPSRVFFTCAVMGSLLNLATMADANTYLSLIGLRWATGFFLAGIYPVGMKIAADYYRKGLGLSLGFLVGALVLGTAFPHLLRSLASGLPWKMVIASVSLLALFGGILLLSLVPDGPHRKGSLKMDFSVLYSVFRQHRFRSAAFGYFGHMWELYAFWAFVPVLLSIYQTAHPDIGMNISLLSFGIIAAGGPACVIGGYLSLRFGAHNIAAGALTCSALCCLLSPVFLQADNVYIVTVFLFFWGMVVVADSPLFSTLVAYHTSPEQKGTALTVVNCIGFAITIVSIQCVNLLMHVIDQAYVFTFLALGPVIGLIVLFSSSEKA